MTAIQVYIDGIGVWGPGLPDWVQAARVLRKETPFVPDSPALPSPALLPPAERRRCPATAKIAVQVAAEACSMAGVDPASLPSVFASSHGDTQITDYMCRELASNAPLSPTRFHNSVHNAPSGYWTIAVGSMHSANAVSGGDDSFQYGLLEAATQCATGQRPVLLVAYDLAAPAPLSSVCGISFSFGTALVLSPARTGSSVVRITHVRGSISRLMEIAAPAELADLQAGNPAARALPLLSSVARKETGGFGRPPLRWEVAPC